MVISLRQEMYEKTRFGLNRRHFPQMRRILIRVTSLRATRSVCHWSLYAGGYRVYAATLPQATIAVTMYLGLSIAAATVPDEHVFSNSWPHWTAFTKSWTKAEIVDGSGN
jgi:hypothetical protein